MLCQLCQPVFTLVNSKLCWCDHDYKDVLTKPCFDYSWYQFLVSRWLWFNARGLSPHCFKGMCPPLTLRSVVMLAAYWPPNCELEAEAIQEKGNHCYHCRDMPPSHNVLVNFLVLLEFFELSLDTVVSPKLDELEGLFIPATNHHTVRPLSQCNRQLSVWHHAYAEVQLLLCGSYLGVGGNHAHLM